MNLTLLALDVKNVMRPFTTAVVKVLNDVGIQTAPGTPEEALGQILNKLKPVIQWAVSIFFSAAAIYFTYRLVIAAVPYFNADNPNDRSQAKEKMKQSAMGIAVSIAGVTLINLVLNALDKGTWAITE